MADFSRRKRGRTVSERRALVPAVAWERVETTEEDWDAADAQLLTSHVEPAGAHTDLRGVPARTGRRGPRARPGPFEHRSGGRRRRFGARLEGRGHGQRLTSWPPPVPCQGACLRRTQGHRPDGRRSPTRFVRLLLRTMAEICGLDRGFGHGRGGSMHLQWKEAGAIGTNALVGGGVPLAAGSAWAHRHAGTDAVAVTYFGDGAINIGSTLESFNLAAAWRLPSVLLRREQLLRSLHERRRGDR